VSFKKISITLIPYFILGALYFLPLFLVTQIAGGVWEVLFSITQKHEINEGFLVTGMLFPLILPPDIPLWQAALGISFGVVLGKEIFGGTGFNFLNPALTARAFVFFAYPGEMTGETVWVAVDGFSYATPLAVVAESGMSQLTPELWRDAFLGLIPGSMGETSTLACLIGAGILIFSGVGSLRIMASVVVGMVVMVGVLNAFAPSVGNPFFNVPWYWHFVLGGFSFGTVYMATDPVSASMTDTGKYIYGFIIGVMVSLVRVVNPAFPEGMMLSILFTNCFSSVIDYFVIQVNIRRRQLRNAG